jgi:hypothetical protein
LKNCNERGIIKNIYQYIIWQFPWLPDRKTIMEWPTDWSLCINKPCKNQFEKQSSDIAPEACLSVFENAKPHHQDTPLYSMTVSWNNLTQNYWLNLINIYISQIWSKSMIWYN